MEYNDSSDSSTSDDDPPSKRSRMSDNLDYLSSDDEGNDSSIAMSSDNPDADLFSNIFDSDESSNHTQSNQSLNSTHAESYYSTYYDYLTEWPDTSSSELSYNVSSDHAINDTEPDSERNSFVYDADDFDFGSSSDDSTFGLTTAAATGTNNNANVPNTNINSSPTSSSTPCIASSSIQNPKVNVSNIWMPD